MKTDFSNNRMRNRLKSINCIDNIIEVLEECHFEHKFFYPHCEECIDGIDEDVVGEMGVGFSLHKEEFNIGGGHRRKSPASLKGNIHFVVRAIESNFPEIQFAKIVKRQATPNDIECAKEQGLDLSQTLYRVYSLTHKLIIEFVFDYETTYEKILSANHRVQSITFCEQPCIRILLRSNTVFR